MASLRAVSLRSVRDAQLIEEEIARLSGDSCISVTEDEDGTFSAVLPTSASVYTAFTNRGSSRYSVVIDKTGRTVSLHINPLRSPRWVVAAAFAFLSLFACVAVGFLVSSRLSE